MQILTGKQLKTPRETVASPEKIRDVQRTKCIGTTTVFI